MVGWYHQLTGHEFEQAPGVGDGQGSLVCCSPWRCEESDMTEWLNWNWAHRKYIMFWFRMLRLKEKNYRLHSGRRENRKSKTEIRNPSDKTRPLKIQKKRNGRQIVFFDETSILYKLHHIFGEQNSWTCN